MSRGWESTSRYRPPGYPPAGGRGTTWRTTGTTPRTALACPDSTPGVPPAPGMSSPVPSFLLNIEVHCSLQKQASSSSTAERRSDAGSSLPEYFTKRRGLSTEEEDGDNLRTDVDREGREDRMHRVDITARPHHQRVFVKSQSSPQMVTLDRSR